MFAFFTCKMQNEVTLGNNVNVLRRKQDSNVKLSKKFTYLRDLTKGLRSNPLKLNLIYFEDLFAAALN